MAGSIFGADALIASAKINGVVGAANGYIADGWKGAFVGAATNTLLGTGFSAFTDALASGTLLKASAIVAENSISSGFSTYTANVADGNPNHFDDVGWSLAIGAASIFGSGSLVADALGEKVVGPTAIKWIKAYENAIAVTGTSLDPNSKNGVAKQGR